MLSYAFMTARALDRAAVAQLNSLPAHSPLTSMAKCGRVAIICCLQPSVTFVSWHHISIKLGQEAAIACVPSSPI